MGARVKQARRFVDHAGTCSMTKSASSKASYASAIARLMPAESNRVLCSAEAKRYFAPAYSELNFAVGSADYLAAPHVHIS